MNRVFNVEISNGKGRFCELSLPATPYELTDALERCGAKPEDGAWWEILEHRGFEFLHPYLENECSIYELNALAEKLTAMSAHGRAAFEGMFKMALAQREGPMSFSDIMTFANSTEACQVVADASDDAQLGRFYAENGFFAELESISDTVYEKLDFAKLGKEMREAERGVFTRCGYVVLHDDLIPDTNSYDRPPQLPRYAFRIAAGRYPFETDGEPEKTVNIELPTGTECLRSSLQETGAASWAEMTISVEDSAVPGLLDNLDGDEIIALNDLAERINEHRRSGELSKFKAVLRATDCSSIADAIKLSYELHRYILSPDITSEEDMACSQLRILTDDDEAARIEKHIDLYGYGKEVIKHLGAELTGYGLVGRRDGGPVMSRDEEMPQTQDMQAQNSQDMC